MSCVNYFRFINFNPRNMSETLTYKNVTVEIEPLMLPARLAEIQARSIQQLVKNPQKWIDAYYAKFGNKTINSDDAKTLFPEYEKDPLANVQAVHEASSVLAKLIFRLRLAELPKGSIVLLTAGGAASGKTHSAQRSIDEAHLVYDSVMKSSAGNRRLIDEIVAARHRAFIIYVYRDVLEAAASNVQRSVKARRIVPFRVLAEGHYYSQQAFINDTDAYAQKKQIQVAYLKNIINQEPVQLSFEEFRKLSYNNLAEVLQQAETSSYEEYEKNKEKYDKRTADALRGEFVDGI